MSMNAIFVQIEDIEIARLEADPGLVEALFADEPPPTAGLLNITATMQECVQAMGSHAMAAMLSRLPDSLRHQIEASLDRTAAVMASGQGGDVMKLIQERVARRAERGGGKREVLSLEKAWHGVHYLLAGAAQPGPELRTQAVLGGVELGNDPEGFAGYGPARYFRATQVRELSEELCRPELDSEVAGRFDPARMSRLHIYPGWRAGAQDKGWLMDAFRRLRDFYLRAAAKGRAVITCLL